MNNRNVFEKLIEFSKLTPEQRANFFLGGFVVLLLIAIYKYNNAYKELEIECKSDKKALRTEINLLKEQQIHNLEQYKKDYYKLRDQFVILKSQT